METILQNISQTLTGWINAGMAALIEILFAANVSGSFTPSIDYWYNDESSAFYGKYDVLHSFCSYLGYFFLIALVGIFILKLLIGGVGEELKDSVKTVGVRLVFCIVLIVGISNLGDIVMSAGSALDAKAQEFFGNPGDSGGSEAYGKLGEESSGDTSFLNSDISTDSLDGDEEARTNALGNALGVTLVGSLGVVAATAIMALFLLVMALRIVILLVAGYKLIKLVVELIARYVTMIIMYTALPIFAPFYLLIETEGIFYSYIKMFISSVMVVVFTRTWISLSFFLYRGIQNSLVEVFVFIAFVEFGCRLEQWFKDIGFSTSSQGKALLDNTIMTAAGMGMALRAAGGVTGKTLVNAGAAIGAGNALGSKLAMAGMGLQGKGMSEASALKGMSESLVGAGKSIVASKGASAIANNLRQGRAELAQGRLNSMDMDNRAKALNNAINELYSDAIKGLSSKGIDKIEATGSLGKDGAIGVKARLGGEHGQEINGAISDRMALGKGMQSIPFKDQDGNNKFLNFADPNATGYKISPDEVLNGMVGNSAHFEKMKDVLTSMDDVDNSGGKYDNPHDEISADDSLRWDIDDEGRGIITNEKYDPESDMFSSEVEGVVMPNGQELFAPQYDATSRINTPMMMDGDEMKPLDNNALANDQMQKLQLMSNFATQGQEFSAFGMNFAASQDGMWKESGIDVYTLSPNDITQKGNNTYSVQQNGKEHTFKPAIDNYRELSGHENFLTGVGQERAGTFVHTQRNLPEPKSGSGYGSSNGSSLHNATGREMSASRDVTGRTGASNPRSESYKSPTVNINVANKSAPNSATLNGQQKTKSLQNKLGKMQSNNKKNKK